MTLQNLSKRLERLENQVAELARQLQAAPSPREKDWRRAIGAFTDDPGMQELLRDAMKLREAERKKARGKRSRP